jgi:hypothetical protein
MVDQEEVRDMAVQQEQEILRQLVLLKEIMEELLLQ